jgi:hypothetical protein
LFAATYVVTAVRMLLYVPNLLLVMAGELALVLGAEMILCVPALLVIAIIVAAILLRIAATLRPIAAILRSDCECGAHEYRRAEKNHRDALRAFTEIEFHGNPLSSCTQVHVGSANKSSLSCDATQLQYKPAQENSRAKEPYYRNPVGPAQGYRSVRIPSDADQRSELMSYTAKAEVGFQVVQRWMVAALRNRKFLSLDKVNQATVRSRGTRSPYMGKEKLSSRTTTTTVGVAQRSRPSQP